MATPRPQPELPRVFGRYVLLRRLARGGMGEIFLAKLGEIQGFEKLCIVKKVLPHLTADSEFVKRFIDEAKIAITLSHANIVTVHEVGMVEGEYFLAMEHVEGRDLRRTMSRLWELKRRTPPEVALFIARELVSGLAYAHRKVGADGRDLGLVHCDVSPPNILLAFEGGVKIIDFGIAKSTLRLTESNPKVGFGKVGYMAPEQLVRGGVVDRRTDLYAAGVILYELLTGGRLFTFPDSADYRAIARIVTAGQIEPPSQRDPALAPFDALCLRALARDPAARFQSGEEMRDEVARALATIAPTMSGDRLGDFLRTQFLEERMEDQARLAELSKVEDDIPDLTDDARTHTVTFALGDSWFVNQTGDVAAHVGNPGGTIEGAGEVTDRAAEQIGRSLDRWMPFSRLRGARRLAPAGALAAGGLICWLLLRQGQGTRPKVVAVQMSTPQPVATAPIAPPPVAPVMAAAHTAPAGAAVAASRPPRGASVASQHAPRSHAPAEVPDPGAFVNLPSDGTSTEGPTEGPVQKKFLRIKGEYEAFKSAYGDRLQAQWDDIVQAATFDQGPGKLPHLSKMLDAFEASMHAVARQ